MQQSKNQLSGYDNRDIGQYFSGMRSCLPFLDSNGKKRLAIIQDVLDEGKVKYKAVLLSRSGVTEKSFTKGINNFEKFDYISKYIKDKDGNLFYIFPRSIKTVAKGVTQETLCITVMNNNAFNQVNSLSYEQQWQYYWGKDLGKNGVINFENKKYVYGIGV